MAEHTTARKGAEDYRDGLLWIGGSYRSIECSAEENCAAPDESELPSSRGKARCFVHEAEWRGISRKVPAVPTWAVPGTTRIFLAHRGGCAEAHQGKIFGYFILHRVEVLGKAATTLAPPDVQEKLPWGGPEEKGELTVMVYDAVTGRPLSGAEVKARADGAAPGTATVNAYRCRLTLPLQEHRLMVSMPNYKPTVLDGIQVPSGKRRRVAVYLQPKQEVAGGKERTERCWDGSVIVTHRFVDGRWHLTGKKCPALPAGKEGAFKSSGGLVEPASSLISIVNELFSIHRACSLRLRPGAVYLVDALCAEINDRFADALRQNELPERYKNARNDDQRWTLVLAGRKKFADIATEVSNDWKAASKVATQPAGRAGHRGELVLFKEPVTAVRKPQAWFRGLERIDGDHLLNQIAAGEREPVVRVYVPPPTKEAGLTKREIAARLAEKEMTTLAAGEGFLDALADVAREELSARGPGAVCLPQIGTLCAVAAAASVSPKRPNNLDSALLKHLPRLDRATVHRFLDHLGQLVSDEVAAAGTLRLPGIGTFRSRGGEPGFTPAKLMGSAGVTFDSIAGFGLGS